MSYEADGKKVYAMKLPKRKHPKFIQKAIKHPGAMTEAAENEGVSNSEYEEEHKHDSGTAGRRARLAITLGGLRGKKAK